MATHDVEFAASFADARGAAGRGASDRRRVPRTRCSRAAGTSRPRWRASSAPALRSHPADGAERLRRADARRCGAMSWQLAAFTLLGARDRRRGVVVRALAADRSRTVALVAALAALAVAGPPGAGAGPERRRDDRHRADHRLRARRRPRASRSARSPPRSRTCGSARAPGRPWQMAGWGLCGLLGAALAAPDGAAGRPPRARVRVRASPGFAYGALLDLSVMVTYGGEQSLDRYLALSARGSRSTWPTPRATSRSRSPRGRRWCG